MAIKMSEGIPVKRNMNNAHLKFIVTEEEFCQSMSICHKTVLRMIADGELPDFTYGNHGRVRGWHKIVLDTHAIKKHHSTENIGDASEVGVDDMGVMPLSGTDVCMPQNLRDNRNRNTLKQKLGCKGMPERMNRTVVKSSVANGFRYTPEQRSA